MATVSETTNGTNDVLNGNSSEKVTGSQTQLQQPKPVFKNIVGIIHPPPEVRNIVEKTASFVARIGEDFESKIRLTEKNNPKFNFLNESDPYHAYYKYKIKEFAEGRATESGALKVTAPSAARSSEQSKSSLMAQQEVFIPKEAPAEFEFVYDPPSINAQDLEIVRLTAQFVSRNGRQFLTQLMSRESRNYQFDFLRPQHALFTYFTKLCEQYNKILVPPKTVVERLEKELSSPRDIILQIAYRVEWSKYQERQKKREAEVLEKERMTYALIDWHDFVVVETVDYPPNEVGDFPPPTAPEDVGARVIAQERGEVITYPSNPNMAEEMAAGIMGGGDVVDKEDEEERLAALHLSSGNANGKVVTNPEDMVLEDDEEAIDKLNDKSGEVPPQAKSQDNAPPGFIKPLPPLLANAVIRKNYNPKDKGPGNRQQTTEIPLVSPFTGETISSAQAQRHIHIGLRNANWLEQKDREAAERGRHESESVLATGSHVEASLKKLAERRTDIFGVGSDETQIGRTLMGERADGMSQENSDVAEKKDDLIWDGHAASAAIIAKKNYDKVLAASAPPPIESNKPEAPLVAAPPPPPPTVPTLPIVAPPPAIIQLPPGIVVNQQPLISTQTAFFAPAAPPPPKKPKTLEDALIPEPLFLAQHNGGIAININVTSQIEAANNVSFMLDQRETVATVKARIAEATGIPQGKQKLQFNNMFLKDVNTLAYYNMMDQASLLLLPKERGGRKK